MARQNRQVGRYVGAFPFHITHLNMSKRLLQAYRLMKPNLSFWTEYQSITGLVPSLPDPIGTHFQLNRQEDEMKYHTQGYNT